MGIKSAAKQVLRHCGLGQEQLDAFRRIGTRSRQFDDVDTFTAVVNGRPVEFRTDDDYSKRWFFPRYADGAIHEPQVTGAIVGALKPTDCFVDIGANLGWYTCIGAAHVPDGRVIAMEMDDLNVELLKRNIDLNGFSHVQPVHTALSDRVGVVEYRRSGHRPSSYFQMRHTAENRKRTSLVSVGSTTLDLFVEETGCHPDVIKMDVEGAECHILKGMTRVLSECRPVLFLEVHPMFLRDFGTSVREVLTILADQGYTIARICEMRSVHSGGDTIELTPDSPIDANDMLVCRAAA